MLIHSLSGHFPNVLNILATATNDVSRPDEQSKLSQVESFKWKRFAFEESLDHKSAGGKRASTDIQVCNGVSPPNEPLITSTVSKVRRALKSVVLNYLSSCLVQNLKVL